MKISEFIASQKIPCWVVYHANSKVTHLDGTSEKPHQYWLYSTAQRIGNGTTFIESDTPDPEMPDYAIEEWNKAITSAADARLNRAFGFTPVRPK